MGSFSGLGIGLSFVFGCILLGLVAELYYLLWWKKKISNRDIEDQFTTKTSYGVSDLSNLFCWKKPKGGGVVLVSRENSSHGLTTPAAAAAAAAAEDATRNNGGREEQDVEMGKDLTSKVAGYGEESVESELMRLHNLCGPPRFLFTIKEETKEDLESEDGKSRSRKGSRTRSLSDLLLAVDSNNTPFLTPLSSPPIKSAAAAAMAAAQSLDSYNHHGFNPLFESMSEAELNKLRSSPPPKFKFLRDAEEKLIKRLILLQEAEKNRAPIKAPSANHPTTTTTMITDIDDDSKNGSFIALIGKNKEREMYQQPHHHHHHHHLHSISTASKVLPLASSPSTFRTLDIKSSMR